MRKERFRWSWRYALSEVLLLTVGIYIALLLNNWNEGRKDRKSEQFYLKSVQSDVTSTIQTLQYHLQLDTFHLKGMIALDSLLEKEEREINEDTLRRALNRFNQAPDFFVTDYNYRSIQQSGDYRIIRSDSLRQLLDELFLERIPSVVVSEGYYHQRLRDGYFSIKESALLAKTGEFIDKSKIFEDTFRDNIYVMPAYIQQEMRAINAALKTAKDVQSKLEREIL